MIHVVLFNCVITFWLFVLCSRFELFWGWNFLLGTTCGNVDLEVRDSDEVRERKNGSFTATILCPRLGLYPESSFSSSLSTETNGSDYSRTSLTPSRGYSRITSLVYHLRRFVGGGQEQDGSLKND